MGEKKVTYQYPEVFAMYCMYALWLFRGPNVRGIQDHKMQGFFGLHNIQMPEFKQPDVKHDQGFCAYELTHPKQVALTQQSFTEVNLYSNRQGTKKKQGQESRENQVLRTFPPNSAPIKIKKRKKKMIKRHILAMERQLNTHQELQKPC